MARRPGGFGFVVLLVVLAAALLLAARAWERSGAPALAVTPVNASTAPARGPEDARDALRDLPDLGEMRDATSRHSEAVRDALAATEE